MWLLIKAFEKAKEQRISLEDIRKKKYYYDARLGVWVKSPYARIKEKD